MTVSTVGEAAGMPWFLLQSRLFQPAQRSGAEAPEARQFSKRREVKTGLELTLEEI